MTRRSKAPESARALECQHPSRSYLLEHWPRCWSCGAKLLAELYISPGCSHNVPKHRPTEPDDWYGFLCRHCNDRSMRRPWTDASWHEAPRLLRAAAGKREAKQ